MKEKKELVLINMPLRVIRGSLLIRASKSAQALSSEVYKESLSAVEIVHEKCHGDVRFVRESKDDRLQSVLFCGSCDLKLEFSPEAAVTTVGELDRELEQQYRQKKIQPSK